MKNNAKNTTLLAFAAGLVAAPVVYYLIHRMSGAPALKEGDYAPAPRAKGIFSAYRGDHKPHHRKADHNAGMN